MSLPLSACSLGSFCSGEDTSCISMKPCTTMNKVIACCDHLFFTGIVLRTLLSDLPLYMRPVLSN